MRWLLLTLTLLLLGCPTADAPGGTDKEGTTDQGASPVSSKDASVEARYPEAALDYIVQCLSHPTEPGYPPLSSTWLVIARMDAMATAPEAASVRTVVMEQVANAGGQVLPGLAAAWLAVSPGDATAYAFGLLATGEYSILDALWHQPEVGQKLLAGIDLATLESRDGITVIKLLTHWKRISGDPIDNELLESLAYNPDDNIRLQAIGLLIAQNDAWPGCWAQLKIAVRIEPQMLAGASEGIKLSSDGSLADALVPLAVQAEMGELNPEASKQREPMYASYALAYLPGEQAQLMRRKLLGAVDPAVRWQARLGELLHGDPAYWQAAVDQDGIDDFDMWVTLEPEDAWHVDLLPTYAEVAQSEQPRQRSLAALHLNRYRSLTSNETVLEIITALVADGNEETRAIAWYTAGELGLSALREQALGIVENADKPGAERIAAAYCALKLAEAPLAGECRP
jgi:hypothetical protein